MTAMAQTSGGRAPQPSGPAGALRIRDLEPPDLDAVVTVTDSVGWTDRRTTLEFFVGRSDSVLFVAELDGAIVGCGGATAFGPRPTGGPTGWIHDIVVTPPARGRGLGRALTQAAIDWLAARRVGTMLLLATDDGLPIYPASVIRSKPPSR